uniref:hypothetical protein n=1 Tax=uncultured Draconibacterium sp. TaxID=1573823 RepID=UPI0032177872
MPQEIIFTTLPHKRTEINGEQFLQLSVYSTIKLSTPKDTTLSEFEDIMRFPHKILEADFQFRLNNGTILDAELVAENIDTNLFENIFHGDIKVDDFKEEEGLKIKNIHSFPIKHINDFVLKSYKEEAIVEPKKLVTPEKFVDENKFGAISRMKLDVKSVEEVETPRRKQSIKATNLFFKNDNPDRTLKNDLRRNRFQKFSKQMDPKLDFVQLRQFHKVDKNLTIRDTPVKLEKPRFEFHDITAVVNSYPQILRKLGFVLDFLIPYTSSNIPDSGTIGLVVNSLEFDEEGTTVSVPATAYNITSTGFYIGDKNDTIFKQGFVKINTDEFSVVQIDADGTALKAQNMAENKVQEIARFYEVKAELFKSENLKIKQMEDAPPPEDEGLPYMRSAGIAITKNGMAEHLYKRVESNIQLKQSFVATPIQKIQMQPRKIRNLQQPGGNIQNIQPQPLKNLALKVKLPEKVLYSTDVIQGYRMDIAYADNPTHWYSLHQRQDEYSWFDEADNSNPVNDIQPDEGFIQLGVAEDPNDPDDVFVSETLARWEGWSLSVRKPGYAINESDDFDDDENNKKDFVYKNKQQEIQKYQFDPDLEFKVNAQSKIVPGTLPKLRFGKDYQVRVRAVDLAGNSVPLEHLSESPEDTTRENIRYMRYEPMASPIVLVGNELKDGEFLERMVIRSNYQVSSTEYENNNQVDEKEFDDYSQRYLLPPKNSQLMAETHSKFEQAFQNNPVAAQEIYNIITSLEGLYEQDKKNEEKIYQPSEVEIIYLPDPMAAGVSLFVSEGYENTHTQEFDPKMFSFFSNEIIRPNITNSVDIPEDWYNAGPIRIRLEEGEQDAQWDTSNRIFTIFLPKGIRTRIKFSTFWREKDMKQLSAIWEMINAENPGNYKELEELATAGQHWMVSPSREFELVHAVQQPVDAPIIEELIPDRDYNTTFALINTRFDIHGESTEKVEFQAKWTEPLDDGISVKIKEKQGRNSISDININYHDDVVTKGTIPEPEKVQKAPIENLKVTPILRIKPQTKTTFERQPQPKARKVNKLFTAQNAQFKQLERSKVSPRKDIVKRVKYDIEATKFSFVKTMNLRILPLEHKFGDTKHRWVDYKLVATSRYREYFDKILKADPNLTTIRESEWLERINILSSARPKAPEIDYIIPTFEWRKTQSNDAVRHQRLGGGLRVYLKRPWYSTGEDEMLGVVLPDAKSNIRSFAASGPSYTNQYTHWGIDPILYGQKPQGVSPEVTDFRMNPVVDSKLQHPDKPGALAKVVAYPVHFDQERQMWFCDMAINPKDMYFPFIKLFLARYQPHSVREENSDVCLSPVVVAKMTQLVPERQTTLRFKKDDQNSKFTLTIEGTIYNLGNTPYGNYNFLRISFLDSKIAQPIYGVINDGENEKKLEDEGVSIKITRKELVSATRFKVEREFRLHKSYKTAPFQVIIEEYERGPKQLPGVTQEVYKNRLEQSEQTDRLIYADVIKINEAGD